MHIIIPQRKCHQIACPNTFTLLSDYTVKYIYKLEPEKLLL